MSAPRKSWKARECKCGKPVETRWQIDITVCASGDCMDAAFRSLGYEPSAETLKRRVTYPTPRTGEDE